MYCIVNPKLFEEFQSMKVKIKPAFSDDWEIIPVAYNSNSDITVRSKKLNVSVAGFSVYHFLQFMKEYNVKTEGLKIIGTFIPGQDRKLYSREDYDKWQNKYSSIVSSKFSVKDLELGRGYKFKCGSKYYYLGKYKNKSGKYERVFANMKNLDKYREGYSLPESYMSVMIIRDSKKLSSQLSSSISKDLQTKLRDMYISSNTSCPWNKEAATVKVYDGKEGILDYSLFSFIKPVEKISSKFGSDTKQLRRTIKLKLDSHELFEDWSIRKHVYKKYRSEIARNDTSNYEITTAYIIKKDDINDNFLYYAYEFYSPRVSSRYFIGDTLIKCRDDVYYRTTKYIDILD